MSDAAHDMLYVSELRRSDGRPYYEFKPYSSSQEPPIRVPEVMVWVRGWLGDIVFDRSRGIIDRAAQPLSKPGFLVVWCVQQYDGGTPFVTNIEQFQELGPALAFAQDMISKEAAAGTKWTSELMEVYVVRTREELNSLDRGKAEH